MKKLIIESKGAILLLVISFFFSSCIGDDSTKKLIGTNLPKEASDVEKYREKFTGYGDGFETIYFSKVLIKAKIREKGFEELTKTWFLNDATNEAWSFPTENISSKWPKWWNPPGAEKQKKRFQRQLNDDTRVSAVWDGEYLYIYKKGRVIK